MTRPKLQDVLELLLVGAILICLFLSVPAQGAEVACPPGDELCSCDKDVVKLDALLVVEEAQTERLTLDLAACEARVCPAPDTGALKWFGLGVGAGVVLTLVAILAT